ncbi:hypothetical protein PVAG01_06981 [Phlyctema vagabunda]|uniref:CFEM domain-containing protein n=1 Tax=Phlyctema vagabunda TaxID=108571 RepID=A0ABR4PB46_9HELO
MKSFDWRKVLFVSTCLPVFTLAIGSSIDLGSRAVEAVPPTCALLCMAEEIPLSTCSPTNATCICLNTELEESITLCVTQNCTIREQLTTKKYSYDSCGVPVRDRTTLVPIIGTVFGVIALSAFVLRILSKALRASANGFWWDDLVLVIVIILMIPFEINSWLLMVRGLGKDIWQVGFNQITGVLFYFYWQELIYLAVLPLLKITFLLLYLRVFPEKSFRRIVWFMIAVNVSYGIAFVTISVFQCIPVSGAWTRWDGSFEGRCNNINLQGWLSAAVNIILDVTTLSLPLFPLWKLNMAIRKKVQVMVMFSVGFFVTVVSIMRLYSLVHFGTSVNVTYDYVSVSYWTFLEIEVGIVCVCMPAIQPLLKKLFPRAFSLGSTVAQSIPISKGLSSKGSKFSAKPPNLNRTSHMELHSREDMNIDDHSSTHELVEFETKGTAH